MDSMASQRSMLLLERLTNNIITLKKRFENIVTLAPVDEKDKVVTASEVYQLEVHAAAMIRAAEDLLVLTRLLKEAWLFGQLGSTFNKDRPSTDINAVEVAKALLAWYRRNPRSRS